MEQSICLKCNKNLKWEEQFISSEGDFCKDCYNEELYKNTTLLGESKLINHAAEAMKNFNEVMEISKRIWDIIDDCIKKAKENAATTA